MDSSAAVAALTSDLNAECYLPEVSEKKSFSGLSSVCNQLLYNINSLICCSFRNKRTASVSPAHINRCSQIWQAERGSSTSRNGDGQI